MTLSIRANSPIDIIECVITFNITFKILMQRWKKGAEQYIRLPWQVLDSHDFGVRFVTNLTLSDVLLRKIKTFVHDYLSIHLW